MYVAIYSTVVLQCIVTTIVTITIYSTVLLYIVLLLLSLIASPSDSLAEVLAFIRIRDQPHVSRTHRVANLNLLAKVS